MYFATELVVYASLKPILTVSISSSDQDRLTRFETDQNMMSLHPAHLLLSMQGKLILVGEAVSSVF